jgi:hypothetical protein
MFGLFGKSKKTDDKEKEKRQEKNKEAAIETMNKLNTQITDMEEKIAHLEAKKNGQVQIAKEKLQKGDKNGARAALQKKKWYDEQIKTTDGAIMMLEEQKMMLDSSLSMGKAYEALKLGNEAISNATENFKVEDLDKIKDEMDENKAAFEEKNEFFKEASTIDNPELDDELDQLAAELENEQSQLPTVADKVKKEIIVNEPVKHYESKNDEKQLEAFLD